MITDGENDDSNQSTYHLKWIRWSNTKIPIVMQSRNGPCPLLATINVLLLREKIKFPPMLESITAEQLSAYLSECLIDCNPPDSLQQHSHEQQRNNDDQESNDIVLNLQQNIHDAIEILPKFNTGLDVNIRFTGITDFEYTPECIVFDLLRIPLYHGWLSDPDLNELQSAIGNQSYNQLVDTIITNKNSVDPVMSAKVLIAEEFLDNTANQLTLYGLQQLKSQIKDNELGILFRNNHFLTLYKKDNEIFTLVTDQGYLTEENVIWEILDNIEGAGRFFDSNFDLADVAYQQVSRLNQFLSNDRLDFIPDIPESVLDKTDQQGKDKEGRSGATEVERDPVSLEEQRSLLLRFHLQQRDCDSDFEIARSLQAEEMEYYANMKSSSSQPQQELQQRHQKSLSTGNQSNGLDRVERLNTASSINPPPTDASHPQESEISYNTDLPANQPVAPAYISPPPSDANLSPTESVGSHASDHPLSPPALYGANIDGIQSSYLSPPPDYSDQQVCDQQHCQYQQHHQQQRVQHQPSRSSGFSSRQQSGGRRARGENGGSKESNCSVM